MMEVYMRHFSTRAVALLALVALLIPGMVLAQTSRTTGAITGTVTDTQGAALPGVTVTVSSPNLQGTRTEVTDAQGMFSVPSVPPGTYKVEYALSGVKNASREGVVVHAQQTSTSNIQMSLAMSETLTVSASQVVVDPTQAAQVTTLDEEHLKYTSVGAGNRTYQASLIQAPGVAMSTSGTSGNPQVSGSNNAQNDWYVDGVNTTDPVTHTFGGNMAFDSIQEITVTTLGKDAEYRSSGGTINVITKSGTNDFSGSLDYRYNDPDFLTSGKETRPQNVATGAFYGGPTTQVLRFNKAAQTDKSKQPQVTFGGPIMRDKLWFFGATHKPDTSRQQPALFGFQPGVRAAIGWNTHGKLTFTPFSNHTLTAKYTDSHLNITNIQDSSFYKPEADARQTQHSKIKALSYDGILSSKWLANVQYAERPSSLAVLPMSGDVVTPGEVDSSTSIRSVNYTNTQGRTSKRNELTASTSYYVDKFGSHAFKLGVANDNNEFTSYNYTTGLLSNVANGPTCASIITAYGLPANTVCTASLSRNFSATVPIRLTVGIQTPTTTKKAETNSIYFQDEWRPIPRLTARLGVRYDKSSFSADFGNDVPDFDLLQPRVGLAFDVFNNASSVIHAYGGKIGDDNQLTLPSFGQKLPSVTVGYNYNATTMAYTLVPSATSVSVSGNIYDPTLSQSFSNQYSFGFTQRVMKNTSVDLTAEYRTQKNLFEDYCGTVAVPQTCMMTNHPGPVGTENPLRADYRALIMKVDSRLFNRIDYSASWTHAKSRGSTESTQNANTSFDRYDSSGAGLDHFTNTYGFLSDDAKDRLKFNGFARLPWNMVLGGSWYWDSGLAYSVSRTGPVVGGTLFLEPRGSRRLPHYNQVDMQLQKDFQFGQVKFGLIGSVFNVLNSELPTGINGNAGTLARWETGNPSKLYVDPNQVSGLNRLSATFGQYTTFQRPRRFEAGVRFEF
jgi:outer membrane receptor for ferrienterochelin and colicin